MIIVVFARMHRFYELGQKFTNADRERKMALGDLRLVGICNGDIWRRTGHGAAQTNVLRGRRQTE
jgi:hypothetical protein